jgi:hypothetical protein
VGPDPTDSAGHWDEEGDWDERDEWSDPADAFDQVLRQAAEARGDQRVQN